MKVTYEKYMKKLWNISGDIHELSHNDEKYWSVYLKLSEALDKAEEVGLITYKEDEE